MQLKSFAKMALMALMGITLSAAPARAAGTIPLALSVQTDTNGAIAANCQATFYQAGTVATKQNIYADFSLSQPLGNPLSCDQSGRLPMFWIADGLIHVRLTNAAGNPIVDTTMQVLGPSSGGGGGGSTVDPTTLMATGDIKVRYGTGPLSGFVRLNGLTIGNATSGASERANADTQAAFVYLCQTDLNLVMVGGRSGNCLSDFNANKQITLPDMRGRVMAALDDMGNSAAGRLTSSYFGTSATVLGAAAGSESRTLSTSNLPPYTPQGDVASSLNNNGIFGFTSPGGNVAVGGAVSGGQAVALLGNQGITSTYTGRPQGGTSAPFASVQPTILATVYLKL